VYVKNPANMLKPAALLVLISALAAQACSNALEEDGGGLTGKYFWAQNLTNSKFYQLKAELLAEGKHCKVWVEEASRLKNYVSSANASALASAYDENIYQKMINVFSIEPVELTDNGATIAQFGDILEFADWLADDDGKLTILLLDIIDGYSPQNGSYTAGYFFLVDFFEDETNGYRSNETDMIYLDTYPAYKSDSSGQVSLKTLAHETQHLMNFATSLLVRSTKDSVHWMDTWIDEGLSSAAEYIYFGSHVEERYKWFKNDIMNTISLGNNFFVWGNLTNASILDDYATVYLFFQWLRIQASGSEIYKEIIRSGYWDYQAVENAAKGKIAWFTGGDGKWDDLFKTWLAANYINAESGKYGYGGEPILKDVSARMVPAGTTSVELLPGEAVYSKTDGNGYVSKYTNGSNIRYAGLKKDGEGTLSDSDTSPDGALLSYNANTNKSGSKETGQLTGLVAETVGQAIAATAASRNIAGGEAREPVRIDARDMLARNGRADGAATFNGTKILMQAALLKDAAFTVESGDE
jgi:hypothetical protein